MAEIHNAGRNRHRRPLIVGECRRAAWLAGSVEESAASIEPCSVDEMRARTVGRAIDNPGLDDPSVPGTTAS